jgi:hypothetical protein
VIAVFIFQGDAIAVDVRRQHDFVRQLIGRVEHHLKYIGAVLFVALVLCKILDFQDLEEKEIKVSTIIQFGHDAPAARLNGYSFINEWLFIQYTHRRRVWVGIFYHLLNH